MFQNPQLTDIASLGEFGLIDHLTKNITLYNKTIKGIGDDAAVFETLTDYKTVITTDLLVEGIHFDLSYFPLKHLGYKAVAVNLSDIYAMFAKPKYILVSMALSSKFTLEAVEEIYAGIQLACQRFHIDLIGGDTSASKFGLTISITAVGEGKQDELVYRNGAKENELLVVSGDLGAAYCGYQLLEREKRVYMDNPNIQPDLSGYDYILERQLKPEPRKDVIDILKALDIKPTSMIDVSDGLSSETLHLGKQSNCGFTIYEDKIPIDPTTYNFARELDLDPTTCALNGGEDYELLFTIKQSDFDKIKNHPDFSIIGHATSADKGFNLITKSGNQHTLKAQGWKAF
ncbi:MAG: thiamine-phosphate kinase [Bacteroidia bacterium]